MHNTSAYTYVLVTNFPSPTVARVVSIGFRPLQEHHWVGLLHVTQQAVKLAIQKNQSGQVKSISTGATHSRSEHPDPTIMFSSPQPYVGSGDLIGSIRVGRLEDRVWRAKCNVHERKESKIEKLDPLAVISVLVPGRRDHYPATKTQKRINFKLLATLALDKSPGDKI